MLSFHCNYRDHKTCLGYFVCCCCCCCFFVQSILFSNITCKGFIYIISKHWKQLYFQFRSIRTRRQFLIDDASCPILKYADFPQGRLATLLPRFVWQFRVNLKFAIISIVTQKKKWNHCHHLTNCTLSWQTFRMRYESLRNVAMHFKAFKCVEWCKINVWGCTNIHIRIWHMQHRSIIIILLFNSSHMRFSTAHFLVIVK